MFRVRVADGSEHEVHADRVVAQPGSVCFETRGSHGWELVLAVPAERVDRVLRRGVEPDGRWTWMRTRPQPMTDSKEQC